MEENFFQKEERKLSNKFKGFGGMKNMSKLLKQAQEMQKKAAEVQENFKNIEISASVGGEAVTIKGNCDYEVQELDIKQDVVEDSEMLKDLLISAFNEYTRKVKERVESEMSAVTGGMNMPF